MGNKIELWSGEGAQAKTEDATFVKAWENLYRACPWATPWQSAGFVSAWYACYSTLYTPLILAQFDGEGTLSGLLPLAKRIADGELVAAGAHQCEYQTWLCPPDGGDFPASALERLMSETGPRRLVLKYLPPDTDLSSLRASAFFRSVGELKEHARPLMGVDEDRVAATLRKRHNKNRINRLKRIGEVELRRVEDPSQFESRLDEMIAQYDFRQGAVNNSLPFQTDPLKRAFHVALMERGLLHVTVLTAGERLIASHMGVRNGECMHVCIPTHTPFGARKLSPFRLLLMLLSKELVAENITVLDLTPGGDPWKEEIATHHDTVHELVLHESAGKRRLGSARAAGEQCARRALNAVHVSPAKLKSFALRLKNAHWTAVPRRAVRATYERKELRVYRYDLKHGVDWDADPRFRINELADLLEFVPIETWQSKTGFLSSSLYRLERDSTAYTYRSGGRLLHSGWCTGLQKKGWFPEIDQEIIYPDHSVALYDFFTDPSARGQGLYSGALRRMLHDLAARPDVEQAFIAVMADNKPSRHVIEKVGFKPVIRFLRRRFLWRAATTRIDLETGSASPAAATQDLAGLHE